MGNWFIAQTRFMATGCARGTPKEWRTTNTVAQALTAMCLGIPHPTHGNKTPILGNDHPTYVIDPSFDYGTVLDFFQKWLNLVNWIIHLPQITINGWYIFHPHMLGLFLSFPQYTTRSVVLEGYSKSIFLKSVEVFTWYNRSQQTALKSSTNFLVDNVGRPTSFNVSRDTTCCSILSIDSATTPRWK